MPRKRSKGPRPIYTIDLETDPFKHGRYPRAFAAGVFTGSDYRQFWGANCVAQAHEYLITLPEGIVYAHNGGRFDIHYCMDWVIGNPMRVINSRIIDAKMTCETGMHSFRDSYAIMPIPLGSYKGKTQKKKIDIKKLEANVREIHKEEILEYLEYDCRSLWELCTAFHSKFGDKLTIGSTAMRELQKLHTFTKLRQSWDAFIRGGKHPVTKEPLPGYYYGGRVEYFGGTGVKFPSKGNTFKIYDVNSMYPHVMRSVEHPIGEVTRVTKEIGPDTCFIKVEGRNYGAFPMRIKGKGLRFDVKYGTFHVSRHEYDTALRLGIFKPKKIILAIDFAERATFATFVDKYYSARLEAKALDDAVNEMFYKLILNSAYGKFSQNPDRYEENIICRGGWDNAPGEVCRCTTKDCECNGWRPKEISVLREKTEDNYWCWRKNSEDFSRFNVATGSSITGASRALLMEAIHAAKNVVYCDTDCVICESLPLKIDGANLGDWKLEGQGTCIAIGGKKMYALFDDEPSRCKKVLADFDKKEKTPEYFGHLLCVKKATKGVYLKAEEIVEVAQGGEVITQRDAPSFTVTGDVRYIKRRVRAT